MRALRATSILAGFAALTLPLMPLQAMLVRFAPHLARRLPHWYHRRVCRLIGLRLDIDGAVARGHPVLLISNHTSWLDIPVLSALAPVSFVAKKEVGTWPGVSALARLQRTVFVDRERRTAVGRTTNDMANRLAGGDNIVLFAEGTSSDGNRVLPFRRSLFAAAKPRLAAQPAHDPMIRAGQQAGHGDDPGSRNGNFAKTVVQTVTITYTRLHGVPLNRADRMAIQMQELKAGGVSYPVKWLARRVAWEFERRRKIDVEVSENAEVSFHNSAIEQAFLGAVAQYELKPWDGPLALFRPPLVGKWQVSNGAWVNSERAYVTHDNDWTPKAPLIEVVEVPGDHDSMVLEPNVRVLAARMKRAIEDAENPGLRAGRVAALPVKTHAAE